MRTGVDGRYITPPFPDIFDVYLFKATEASGFVNPLMVEQVNEAKRLGKKWGVWHYYRNHAGPRDQAQWFYEHVAPVVGMPDYVILDCEDTASVKGGLLPSRILECAKQIEARFGMPVEIYTGAWWWDPYVGAQPWQVDFEWWVAHYTTASAPKLPAGVFEWWGWQYAGDITHPGFNAKVDLSRIQEDETPPPPPGGLEKRVTALEALVQRIREAINQ